MSVVSFLLFPPTAWYSFRVFADMLFIKQQHQGIQIIERKVKKGVNKETVRGGEAPSDVITRPILHRLQEGFAGAH